MLWCRWRAGGINTFRDTKNVLTHSLDSDKSDITDASHSEFHIWWIASSVLVNKNRRILRSTWCEFYAHVEHLYVNGESCKAPKINIQSCAKWKINSDFMEKLTWKTVIKESTSNVSLTFPLMEFSHWHFIVVLRYWMNVTRVCDRISLKSHGNKLSWKCTTNNWHSSLARKRKRRWRHKYKWVFAKCEMLLSSLDRHDTIKIKIAIIWLCLENLKDLQQAGLIFVQIASHNY